jgi:RNA polymerase sigma-70 factor (ECF subfamily)
MGQAASIPQPLDDVLLQAQGGDAAAFAEVVRTHEAMVFSLARHFVRDRAAAEDLAQDVFLELYRNLARVESAAHLTFWLRRVTSHRCIDRLRRQSLRPETTVDSVAEPSAPGVMPDILLEGRLRNLVDALPSHARLVVVLRYQEDLDPSEIAEMLGMSINTVKSHLRRAVERLRGQLTEGGGRL